MAQDAALSKVGCGICGQVLVLSASCRQAHHEHCHDCHTKNLAAGYDGREHAAPTEALVLSPRDVQALVTYQERVRRLREEEPDHA